MNYKKYLPVYEYNDKNIDIQKILNSNYYIFPKLDGVLISLWMDKNELLHIGDNKKEIFLIDDSELYQKICTVMYNSFNLLHFFKENPNLRLYGIWLKPIYITDYPEFNIGKFYIIDVVRSYGIWDRNLSENIDLYRYLDYNEYSKILRRYQLNYVQDIERCPDNVEDLIEIANSEDEYLSHAGIVIKDYMYYDKNGKQCYVSISSDKYKRLKEIIS